MKVDPVKKMVLLGSDRNDQSRMNIKLKLIKLCLHHDIDTVFIYKMDVIYIMKKNISKISLNFCFIYV